MYRVIYLYELFFRTVFFMVKLNSKHLLKLT